MKLRVFVFVAACTLSMASFATVHVACKSGQKPARTGSQACVPAPASSSAKAKAPAKSAVRSKAPAKGKAASRTKASAKNRGKAPTITQAAMQPAAELPASSANVDCDSTQTILQGGGQCPTVALPNGAAVQPTSQANPGTSCFAALSSSNSARRLAARVPFLSNSAPSPEALANRGVPNKMEKEELGSVMAGYGMCLDMSTAWRREAYAPAVLSALDAYWHDAQSILKELATGKRTYGDAARAIDESDKTYKRQLGSLERKP